MSVSLADDLALALRLADEADAVSLSRFRALDLRVETKPDRTPVTDADRAVEQALRAVLDSERSADGVLGEEFGATERGDRQWILDPIDGTANFLRGLPNWSTLIALAVDGTPQVGVVSAPAFGLRAWAARGSGAWLEDGRGGPRRLQVSGVSQVADAWLSFQSIRQWDDAGELDRLIGLSRAVWRDRAFGDMWSYVLLAEGAIDIVGEFDVQPYDIAAVIPIIEEAGGRFTSVAGEPGPWNGSALATNGRLHDAVLDWFAPRS